MILLENSNCDLDCIADNDVYIRYYHNGVKTDYFIGPVNNGVYSALSGKLLTPSIKNGYHEYHLYINGKKVTKTYNNLIGLTALDNDDPINKTEVDHIYGNKNDNDYKRLEWVTHRENNRRARKTGLNKPLYGENNGYCKYTDAEIEECIEYLLNGCTVQDASTKTGISASTIYGLIDGTKRPELTKGIKFPDSVYAHKQRNKRATNEELEKVRELRKNGLSAKEIAKIMDCDIQKIYNMFYYKKR